MANTVTFLILFVFVFFALASVYGTTSGSLPDIQNTMNQITGPWPTISTANCSFSQNGPTGNCNILDVVELGLIWLIASFGSALFRIGAGFYLIYQMATILSPLTQIPFVGPIFVGFVVILGLYAYSMFRGNRPPE